MKELYGFSMRDFLRDIWSDPNDCRNEWSLLVALLSSSLAGVLKGEAAGSKFALLSTLSGLMAFLTSLPGVLSIYGFELFSALASSLVRLSSSTTSSSTLGVDATECCSASCSLSCFFLVSIDNCGFSLASFGASAAVLPRGVAVVFALEVAFLSFSSSLPFFSSTLGASSCLSLLFGAAPLVTISFYLKR